MHFVRQVNSVTWHLALFADKRTAACFCIPTQVSYDKLMQHATRLMMSTPRRSSSVSTAYDHATAATAATAAAAAAAASKIATAAPSTGKPGATLASTSSTGCSSSGSGILAGLALQDHINALYSSLSDVHRATFVEVSISA
jgi:hypothetical protein